MAAVRCAASPSLHIRESSAAPDVRQLVGVVETAERVESCDVEAMFLSLCIEDIEAGRAAAHEDVVEIHLRSVHHVQLVVAAGVLDIARQQQNTDGGGAPCQLQQVPDEAEALP